MRVAKIGLTVLFLIPLMYIKVETVTHVTVIICGKNLIISRIILQF